MRAILCDSCGKIIDNSKQKENVREIEIRKSNGEIAEQTGYLIKEICIECAFKIEKMLRSETSDKASENKG